MILAVQELEAARTKAEQKKIESGSIYAALPVDGGLIHAWISVRKTGKVGLDQFVWAPSEDGVAHSLPEARQIGDRLLQVLSFSHFDLEFAPETCTYLSESMPLALGAAKKPIQFVKKQVEFQNLNRQKCVEKAPFEYRHSAKPDAR